jgi:transposase
MIAAPTIADAEHDRGLARVVELERENAELKAELATARAARDRVVNERDRLAREVEKLKRDLFGRSSERVVPEPESPPGGPDRAQGPPNAAAATGQENSPQSARKTPGVKKPKRSRRGKNRRPLSPNIPRVRNEILPPEAERTCACCGRRKVKIGEEVSHHYERPPRPSVILVETARVTMACPKGCEGEVTCPPAPPAPIERGRAGPGLLAWILVTKFGDHVPLNRILRMLARDGVSIAASTLCGWVDQAAGLLEAIVDYLRSQILASDVVRVDETGVLVKDMNAKTKDNPRKARQARMWVYRGADVGFVFYLYSDTKANDDPVGPGRVLNGFIGYVQADGYAGYDQLFRNGFMIEVACWAHARRYFFDALKSSPKEAQIAIDLIRELYAVEADAKTRKLDAGGRLALRAERSAPIVERFFVWIKTLDPVPGTPLADAVRYTTNLERALRRFLEDGRLEIDNTGVERDIRPVALGRNSWLFLGSPASGGNAAICYSLIASCRDLEINPLEYITDVLTRVSTHPARRVAELAPHGWKEARRARAPDEPVTTARTRV